MSNQFELTTFSKAKVSNVETLTSKKREPDTHPGIGIDVSLTVPNEVLASFDVDLKPMLFTKKADAPKSDKERRRSLEGMEMTDLPNLSNIGQHVRTISWAQELAGYTLEVAYGIDRSTNIFVKDCELSRFRITPREGGSTDLKFRMEAPNVDATKNGRLQVLKDTEIELKLIAPTPEAQQATVEGAQQPSGSDKKPPKNARAASPRSPRSSWTSSASSAAS